MDDDTLRPIQDDDSEVDELDSLDDLDADILKGGLKKKAKDDDEDSFDDLAEAEDEPLPEDSFDDYDLL